RGRGGSVGSSTATTARTSTSRASASSSGCRSPGRRDFTPRPSTTCGSPWKPPRRPDGRTGPRSALAVDDESAGRIVGRDRDGHPVAEDDADPVPAGVAGQLRENLVAVLAADAEVSALAHLDDLALKLDQIVFAHRISTPRPVVAGMIQKVLGDTTAWPREA